MNSSLEELYSIRTTFLLRFKAKQKKIAYNMSSRFKMRLNLYKAFLLAGIMLLMVYSPIETFKYHLKSRQINYCANHAMGDFVKNPFDCKLFFWCGENGQAVDASCPPNMLFNEESSLCDTPTNVRCNITTATPPAATTSSPSMPNSPSTADQYCYNLYSQQPTSNALVFLAHPRNCQQYYMCYHGQALLQECSLNLHWNSKIGKCDLPLNANCLIHDIPSALPPMMTTTPSSDNPSWGDTSIVCPSYGQHIFPHMQRCDFFIYCVKGNAILQKCPFYYHFDVESGRCKWRNMALCVKDLNLIFRKNKSLKF